MTKDEALTMIIASIAMEESALSHIINAEGEKLQYVLGTLPGGPKTCASTQEILAVNKSVTGLLDAVMQNQMLLKNKLERTLEASGTMHPEKPCPCEPPCTSKGSIQLINRCNGFLWNNGCLMPWRCRRQKGEGIQWNEEMPALVELDPEKTYTLSYTVNVRRLFPGADEGTVCVKRTPHDAFWDTPPLHFSVKDLENGSLTLQYSAVLFPQACAAPYSGVSLLLNYRDRLCVEQAVLNIIEL